jgi:hypothetical protein
MAIDLKEFQQLKNNVARLQRESAKAAGALEEQMKRLKTEFGCDTMEGAQKLLKKLDAEVTTAERQYQTSMAKFQKDWSAVLEDL